MAERLSDVAAQIQNVRQLAAVVTAMRGIAASRAQKGRARLAGIEAYTDIVSRAIGEALNFLPTTMTAAPAPRRARRGLILFCAEQGFAGAFSEHVFEAAGGDLQGQGNESRLTVSWAQYLQQVLWIPAGALAAALDGLLVENLAHQIESEVADHRQRADQKPGGRSRIR